MANIPFPLEQFKKHLYREREVVALELNKENQPAIVEALHNDLDSGRLVELKFDYDKTTKLYNVYYRYADELVARTLTPGQVLFVVTTDPKLVKQAMDADAFLKAYEVVMEEEKLPENTIKVNLGDLKTFSDAVKDALIQNSVPLTEKTSVNAKSVTMRDTEIHENGCTALTAVTGDIILDNVTSKGILPKSVSNTVISANGSNNIQMSKVKLTGASYNAVEIGLNSTSRPKVITIEDLTVVETSNNGVLIFNTVNEAIVTIKDCKFIKTSNPIRISNRDNVKVTINITNCDFGTTESAQLQYGGIFICEDYIAKTAEEAIAANRFAPEKVKINFTNCRWKGQPLTQPEDLATVLGTKNESQMGYVYYDKGGNVDYDATKYPAITIK